MTEVKQESKDRTDKLEQIIGNLGADTKERTDKIEMKLDMKFSVPQPRGDAQWLVFGVMIRSRILWSEPY